MEKVNGVIKYFLPKRNIEIDCEEARNCENYEGSAGPSGSEVRDDEKSEEWVPNIPRWDLMEINVAEQRNKNVTDSVKKDDP